MTWRSLGDSNPVFAVRGRSSLLLLAGTSKGRPNRTDELAGSLEGPGGRSEKIRGGECPARGRLRLSILLILAFCRDFFISTHRPLGPYAQVVKVLLVPLSVPEQTSIRKS